MLSTFEVAKDAFLAPAANVKVDDSDPDEDRWRSIGLAGVKLLLVVFTEPDGCHPRHLCARSEEA